MRCYRLLVVVVSMVLWASATWAEILPFGVLADDQTSIVYYPDTGEVAVDVPPAPPGSTDGFGGEPGLVSIFIDSAVGIFAGNLGRCNDLCSGGFFELFCTPGSIGCDRGIGPGETSFGEAALPGLTQDYVIHDLTVLGALRGYVPNPWIFDALGPVDLVYMRELYPGDANRDFSFDQLDLVQVQQAAKYLSGQPATWGEGDWNGGPGGYPGEPPPGDGFFDQRDIVAALQTGTYMRGPYAAISPGGIRGDERTSIIYDANTGEVIVDAPRRLTSINIDSAAGIFTNEPAQDLGGSFDNDEDNNIFFASFRDPCPYRLFFGNVAQPGLSEDFVANDLTVVGSAEYSFPEGVDLGDVDLIYIPEPSSLLLALLGIIGLLHWRRR